MLNSNSSSKVEQACVDVQMSGWCLASYVWYLPHRVALIRFPIQVTSYMFIVIPTPYIHTSRN